MTLLRQLARNVPGCVTDLEAGGQSLGLPWRERLAGRPHRMRAQVVPDQDDPPPRGTGRPTPTAASRPRRLSWRFPARCAPCARARRRTLPDRPPRGVVGHPGRRAAGLAASASAVRRSANPPRSTANSRLARLVFAAPLPPRPARLSSPSRSPRVSPTPCMVTGRPSSRLRSRDIP